MYPPETYYRTNRTPDPGWGTILLTVAVFGLGTLSILVVASYPTLGGGVLVGGSLPNLVRGIRRIERRLADGKGIQHSGGFSYRPRLSNELT